MQTDPFPILRHVERDARQHLGGGVFGQHGVESVGQRVTLEGVVRRVGLMRGVGQNGPQARFDLIGAQADKDNSNRLRKLKEKGKLDGQLREALMDSYFTPVPTETVVCLIDKDGMLKSRSADLDLEATFGLIDQMPMRRAEMRRKSEGLN